MSALSLTSLASRINREHEAALRDASSAIERARVVGKLLLEAKEQCERGKWKSWLSENCSDISQDTAERYMNVARHPEIEATSVRNAILKLAPPEKREPNKSARVRISQVIESEPEVSQKTHATSVLDLPKPAQLAAATAKATPPPQNDEPERPDEAEEDAALEAAERDWRARMDKVLIADDKLSEMAKQLKQIQDELTAAKQARDRYMNENAALLRQNKALQRKLDKLEKKAA